MNDAATSARMIAPDLVATGPDGPRIIAWRHRTDSRIVFPMPAQQAGERDGEPVLLSRHGTLWSWTVQRFRPKTPPYIGPDPATFRPYAVGYVEFPEGIIVEGRIDVDVESGRLQIGTLMETTVIPLFTDCDGRPVQIYAFRPVEQHRALAGG